MNRREQIARVLDEEAWNQFDRFGPAFMDHMRVRWDRALAKADQIMAVEGEANDDHRVLLLDIVARLEDEGDRVFLGSTNDAEHLRRIGQEMDTRAWRSFLKAPTHD